MPGYQGRDAATGLGSKLGLRREMPQQTIHWLEIKPPAVSGNTAGGLSQNT
jgi:hypothetical protein